ncbi:MAG: glycerol-3-phosphate acyltransferase [Gammaproteobacteria bacterium]|nr:MAG: glycerol-3-phosphate acyltransferase [Gammaproteobacteria bacterium]
MLQDVAFWAAAAAALLAAYLIGSLSCAILSCRLLGLPDPRGIGSGNPGATNVLRTGDRRAAIITLLGDAGKGVLAVLLARAWLGETVAALAALAAVAGHVWPVYHGFKGGKGVATALGALAAFEPAAFLAAGALWLAVAWLWRYASAASLAALAGTVPLLWGLGHGPVVLAAFFAVAVLVAWRHRDNVRRLIRGEERRIGEKAA